LTTGVLRSHRDVTPAFLTDTLRAAGWIGDAEVVDVDVSTIGAGQMGVCARYSLTNDRDVTDAPADLVGGERVAVAVDEPRHHALERFGEHGRVGQLTAAELGVLVQDRRVPQRRVQADELPHRRLHLGHGAALQLVAGPHR
jgi:hypothetical protein